ncbi:MAG: hypothetical protein VW551_05770 [Euryarchaeota archaeon]
MSVYAKNNGTWVPVGPSVNIFAEAARQEGLEEGLRQGYNKAQEDLYTAVEEVKAKVGDAADAIVDEVVSRVTAAATKAVTVDDFDIETDEVEENDKNPNKGSGNNSGKGGKR